LKKKKVSHFPKKKSLSSGISIFHRLSMTFLPLFDVCGGKEDEREGQQKKETAHDATPD
jgi:hypothetical protein